MDPLQQFDTWDQANERQRAEETAEHMLALLEVEYGQLSPAMRAHVRDVMTALAVLCGTPPIEDIPF